MRTRGLAKGANESESAPNEAEAEAEAKLRLNPKVRSSSLFWYVFVWAINDRHQFGCGFLRARRRAFSLLRAQSFQCQLSTERFVSTWFYRSLARSLWLPT